MAYRLYLNDILSIKYYDEFQHLPAKTRNRVKRLYDKVTPLRFKIFGKVKDSFKIEDIDALLCSYKDKQSFLNELKKHNISYLSEQEKLSSTLTLTYHNNKQTKEAPIIFDNLLLFEQAISFRNAKKNKNSNNKILTENSDKLNFYIKFMKSLVLNKTTKYFILNPKSISYLTYEERLYLESDVLNDIYKDDKLNRQGLRSLLFEYDRYYNLYIKNSNLNISTLDIERELNRVDKNINTFFRSNYRNLRKMVEWQEHYKEVLLNHIDDDNLDNKQKEIIKLQIKKIDMVHEYINDKKDPDEYLFIDEEEIYSIYNDSNEITSFQNEQLQYLYNTGGIEEVMNLMDLDQILSIDNDAKKIGIVKQKNINKNYKL